MSSPADYLRGLNAGRSWLSALLVGACLAICTAPALAQEEPGAGGVAAELIYDQIDGELLLGLRLKFGYEFVVPQIGCDEAEEDADACDTRLKIALQAPLRVPLGGDDSGFLRQEDWDELSDYLRIVRTLEYGSPDEALHAHFGELGPASLGHGTIVRNYYNVITTDHYKMGAAADLNTVYGGAELLIDHLIDPGVSGGRVFVNPWAFVDADNILARVGFGATLVADLQAPTRLKIADELEPNARPIAVDSALNPVVEASQTTSFVGFDVEFPLVEAEQFGLVPYADFSHHTSLGSGFYGGLFLNYQPTDELEFRSQLEYRRVGEKFLPTYFGPIYEIERFQFLGWGQELPAPKVRQAASLKGGAAHGFYGSLSAQVSGLFDFTAAYADHQGPDNRLAHLKASVTPAENIQLGAFYHKQYFDVFADLLDLDGVLIAAESRVGVWGPLYLLGRYGRLWQVDPDGYYQNVHDFSLGIGASMGF